MINSKLNNLYLLTKRFVVFVSKYCASRSRKAANFNMRLCASYYTERSLFSTDSINHLRVLAAAGIFVFALLFPVLLCGCGDKAESGEMLLSMETETQTESSAHPYEESADAVFESGKSAEIYVYICGAVEKPDVYRVNEGSRLFEVIELAGGFTKEADRACLNLARNVSDGEQIVVYTVEETAKKMTQVSENGSSKTDSGLVNINTASLKELTGISGIGESRAQAIIDYRDKNGGFKSVEEIKKVDGIKDGLFSKIKDYITI